MDSSYVFMIGNFSGLFLGFLLFCVIYMVNRHFARKALRDLFDKYGVPNGLDYYQGMAKTCPDEEGRRLLEEEADCYLVLQREHEDRMNQIARKYPSRE